MGIENGTSARQSVAERSTGHGSGALLPVTDDVVGLRIVMVNVYFVGTPGSGGPWALVDAGLIGSEEKIIQVAQERFGDTPPVAIIMTHGHFDHVGALKDLAKYWNVPVYAHPLEMPYLTGRSAYPPPDPTVGGGMMAVLSRFYPRDPVDLGDRALPLPDDATVPGMPGWRWIHTPGHSAGHVSFFRDDDRVMIVGDAFVTTRQESALSVLTQRQEVHGPPAYFTTDWDAAHNSVRLLASLEPSVAATGHGTPMKGKKLARELTTLARSFDRLALPVDGRYVREPALANEEGIISIPPPVVDPLPKILAGVGVAALTGAAIYALTRRNGNDS
jgi:glyoxylase-like metal-dependent hydrolase (beta-lactamase superfamily II)